MKPILIGPKTQERLLVISAEINRLSSERDGLLTANMEASGVEQKDWNGYRPAQDFSRLIPPPEQKKPKAKIPKGGKKK